VDAPYYLFVCFTIWFQFPDFNISYSLSIVYFFGVIMASTVIGFCHSYLQIKPDACLRGEAGLRGVEAGDTGYGL